MGAINPTMAGRFKKYENGGEVEESNSTFQNSPDMVGGRDMTAMYKQFTKGTDIGTSLKNSNLKKNPLGGVQDTLSVLGLTPGIAGVAADVANAGLSIGQGNFKDGASNLVSAVDPTGLWGSATTGSMIGTKIGEKLAGIFEEGGEVPKKEKKSLQDIVFDSYNVEYKGKTPLGLDEFPMIQDFKEKGRPSNLITQSYEVTDDDGKTHYGLEASMHKGKLTGEGKEKDLGLYESEEERKNAETAIKHYQSMLSPSDLNIRRDGQITANNVKALRAEIEKELLGN